MDCNPKGSNSLTVSTRAAFRTAVDFPTDREWLERIAPTVGKFDMTEVTIGWVRNSLELGIIALSENLLSQIQSNPLLEIVAPPQELEFDSTGNLAVVPEEI